jgi:HNH endonuclease
MKLTKNGYGYLVFNKGGKVIYQHIILAESALGKPLPRGAEVHHVDGNPSNCDPKNLVICPSHAYHFLIELRTRAYDACGDPNKRRCSYCKQWDDTVNMYTHPRRPTAYHRDCHMARMHEIIDSYGGYDVYIKFRPKRGPRKN